MEPESKPASDVDSLNDGGSISLTVESLMEGEACKGKSMKQNKEAKKKKKKMKLSNPIYFTKIKDPLQNQTLPEQELHSNRAYLCGMESHWSFPS